MATTAVLSSHDLRVGDVVGVPLEDSDSMAGRVGVVLAIAKPTPFDDEMTRGYLGAVLVKWDVGGRGWADIEAIELVYPSGE